MYKLILWEQVKVKKVRVMYCATFKRDLPSYHSDDIYIVLTVIYQKNTLLQNLFFRT